MPMEINEYVGVSNIKSVKDPNAKPVKSNKKPASKKKPVVKKGAKK